MKLAAAAGSLILALSMSGSPSQPSPPPPVSDARLASTVTDIELDIDDIELPEAVDVVTERVDDGERVLDLNTDILFAFGSAEVVPAGVERVAELVADLDTGAPLTIAGHTDSVGDDASNLLLSQQRAEAVAAVIRSSRPDLVLTVVGYGEAQPIAPNTTGESDDPAGRALNRRVELRVG